VKKGKIKVGKKGREIIPKFSVGESWERNLT